MDGKLIVGDRLAHSRLLLSHILRGWGTEAVVALALELLWWQALTHSFDAPMITAEDAAMGSRGYFRSLYSSAWRDVVLDLFPTAAKSVPVSVWLGYAIASTRAYSRWRFCQ